MSVSKRLRFEILRRDNHACRYCGATAPEVKLLVDHVVPEALGGPTEPANLVTACEPCNSGKSSIAPDSPLVENARQDAVRWANAMSKAHEIRRAHIEEREAYARHFRELWDAWSTGPEDARTPIPLDDDWRSTIDKFFEYDVHPRDIEYAVETAMGANAISTFRYFCSVVWNIIREIQRTATQLVATEDDG